MNLDEELAKMRTLLDGYEGAMKLGDPATARDLAFGALHVLNALYNEAYLADMRKRARGEGKAG